MRDSRDFFDVVDAGTHSTASRGDKSDGQFCIVNSMDTYFQQGNWAGRIEYITLNAIPNYTPRLYIPRSDTTHPHIKYQHQMIIV